MNTIQAKEVVALLEPRKDGWTYRVVVIFQNPQKAPEHYVTLNFWPTQAEVVNYLRVEHKFTGRIEIPALPIPAPPQHQEGEA